MEPRITTVIKCAVLGSSGLSTETAERNAIPFQQLKLARVVGKAQKERLHAIVPIECSIARMAAESTLEPPAPQQIGVLGEAARIITRTPAIPTAPYSILDISITSEIPHIITSINPFVPCHIILRIGKEIATYRADDPLLQPERIHSSGIFLSHSQEFDPIEYYRQFKKLIMGLTGFRENYQLVRIQSPICDRCLVRLKCNPFLNNLNDPHPDSLNIQPSKDVNN